MTQLKGFKLVTSLVLIFKKIESKDKTKHDNFYSSSNTESDTESHMKMTMMMCLNQSILQ